MKLINGRLMVVFRDYERPACGHGGSMVEGLWYVFWGSVGRVTRPHGALLQQLAHSAC